MPEPTPYPWAALDRLSRSCILRARQARSHFAGTSETRRLEAAIERVLGSSARLYVQRAEARDAPRRFPAARVALELADGAAGVVLGFESRLAARVIAHLLERPPAPEPPELPLDPTLAGALAAVVIEVSRGAASPRDMHVVLGARDGLDKPGLLVHATLLVADEAYDLAAWAWSERSPTAGRPSTAHLADIGGVELALRTIVGRCTGTVAELGALRIGDGWSCGAGWGIGRDGSGFGWLSPPRSERGLPVEFSASGEIMVRGGVVELPMDVEKDAAGAAPDAGEIDGLVLEAPIVVRVELGAVSMLARDWAELRPGDVIQTGRRISEPAVLRVAGREVARGELVDVEGELAVRICELRGSGEDRQ